MGRLFGWRNKFRFSPRADVPAVPAPTPPPTPPPTPNPACNGVRPCCRCVEASLAAIVQATINHEKRIEEFRRAVAEQDRRERQTFPRISPWLGSSILIFSLSLPNNLVDRRACQSTDSARAALEIPVRTVTGNTGSRGRAARNFDCPPPGRRMSEDYLHVVGLAPEVNPISRVREMAGPEAPAGAGISGSSHSYKNNGNGANSPIPPEPLPRLSSQTKRSQGLEQWMSHLPSSQGVLKYLQDMRDLCKSFHRPDLEREYIDAWELAATTIYGPLPPRKPMRSAYTQWATEEKPATMPGWKREMLAKPFRQVIGRDGMYEILSCGHRLFHTPNPESPNPRRRRCGDCVQEQAASETPPRAKGKAVSA